VRPASKSRNGAGVGTGAGCRGRLVRPVSVKIALLRPRSNVTWSAGVHTRQKTLANCSDTSSGKVGAARKGKPLGLFSVVNILKANGAPANEV